MALMEGVGELGESNLIRYIIYELKGSNIGVSGRWSRLFSRGSPRWEESYVPL